MSYTKPFIVETLKSNVATVKFTKVSGEKRDMLCTLREDKLPPAKVGGRTVTPNDAIVRAYDLEKAGWRSFKVDSVEAVIIQE